MPSKPWMPLYPEDYLRDTRHLSLAQHGLYVLMIMRYWESGPLPADPMKLAKLLGVPPRSFCRHFAVIQRFFTEAFDEQLQSKCLRHKRIDLEREKAETLSLKRAYAGGKGGSAPRKPIGFLNGHLPSHEQLLSNRGVQPHKKEYILTSQSDTAPQQKVAAEVASPPPIPQVAASHGLRISPELQAIMARKIRERT